VIQMDYTITIKFGANRELTEQEINDLETQLWAQVGEPQVAVFDDASGQDQGWVDAEYETGDVSIVTENK